MKEFNVRYSQMQLHLLMGFVELWIVFIIFNLKIIIFDNHFRYGDRIFLGFLGGTVVIGMVMLWLWYKYDKSRNSKLDLPLLTINKQGIHILREGYVQTIRWKYIDSIEVLRYGNTIRGWGGLSIQCINGNVITKEYEYFRLTINYYKLVKAIKYFSNREDIVTKTPRFMWNL